ncbi:MAG: ribosome small subunit-dependent GTPase A [Phycisphaerae bacterium]
MRRRKTDWTQQAREADDHEIDTDRSESVLAKGELSRRRTVRVHTNEDQFLEGLRQGTIIAVRGLYADVDDGELTWPCTIRRVLRTRLIEERHPVTVGDRVRFRVESEGEGVAREGVIEAVEPRGGQLQRHVRRRVHTIVANVDQAIIVSSADQPPPKPHLIDRYIVAALAGDITPVVCMNKTDLDRDGSAVELLDRYARLDYVTLATSAVTGDGIESLRDVLKGKASVIAGQSGVGKSSMLNAVQPGLRLKIGDIIEQTSKGRHTTATATLIRLEIGGYVVDTPGIRSFDLATVGRDELEAHFVEFLEYIPDCKFPDCTHRHEGDCAVKQAVERGDIHPERYKSYVRLFEEPTNLKRRSRSGE